MMKKYLLCMMLIMAIVFSFSGAVFADSGDAEVPMVQSTAINVEKDVVVQRAYWNLSDSVTINEDGKKATATFTLTCLENEGAASGFVIYDVPTVTMKNKSGWEYVKSAATVISKSIAADKQSATVLIEYTARAPGASMALKYQAYATVSL